VGALLCCCVAVVAVLNLSSGAGVAVGKTRPTTTGLITAIGTDDFVIGTTGGRVGLLNRLTAAATRIGLKDYPYVWGGGHVEAGVPSIGVPGHNNTLKRKGYDCSGAVGALFAAVGVMPAGQSVPNDAGIVEYLLSRGLIAPGAGVGPDEVTIYDKPGNHIFINIDGRFWGTVGAGASGDSLHGPDWLDGGVPGATGGYKLYHFVRSALGVQAGAGYDVAFQGHFGGLRIGQPVSVAYRDAGDGAMVATSVGTGEIYTVHGKVIGRRGEDFTVSRGGGGGHRQLRFRASGVGVVRQARELIGAQATVTYVKETGIARTPERLVALSVTRG
jgi:hypothetical protein